MGAFPESTKDLVRCLCHPDLEGVHLIQQGFYLWQVLGKPDPARLQQDLEVGDEVKMCVTDPAPPPYIVAQIFPNEALVMGHQESGEWVDLWQFILVPQADGSTRLILRTRTMMVGGFWDIIHPGVFIMERGLLLGVKERAENMQ